jgi:signal transduction histidine kinase
MNAKTFRDRVWRSWDLFFKLTKSFGARLFGVSLLGALAFLTAYLLQGPYASQIPVVTIVAAVLMALCGGVGLGLVYTLLFGAAVDYFFIPPLGQIFVTTEARQQYFLATLAAVFIGLLVSSLRMAFQRIDSAMQSAEAAVRARDEMVAMISHELKNPITSLQTGTILIQRLIPQRPENERVMKLLDKLPPSIHRMNLLVADLLDITRLEAHALTLHPSDCGLVEIAQEVVGSFTSAAQNKSVDLRITEFPSEATRAFCDPTRTAQILENLVNNAIKFTDAGGSVRVSASKEDDYIEIRVADTGRGIPSDYLPHVFDRFWQAKEIAYKGTGLGLAIAKGLAEAQGGTIKVRSEEGRGSCFSFTLPSKAVLKPSAKKAG